MFTLLRLACLAIIFKIILFQVHQILAIDIFVFYVATKIITLQKIPSIWYIVYVHLSRSIVEVWHGRADNMKHIALIWMANNR